MMNGLYLSGGFETRHPLLGRVFKACAGLMPLIEEVWQSYWAPQVILIHLEKNGQGSRSATSLLPEILQDM